MKDVYDMMSEEDLTPDLMMMADVCGLETLRQLLRNFAGLSFYIPKISRLDKLIMKYVRSNRDKSYKQIAKDLNVSEIFLKKLIKSR